MDSLEQNAIIQLLSIEDKESQNRWDIKSPINQIPKVKSLNQARKKKVSQSMEQKQVFDYNHEFHFNKFPKIHQQEHSFKSLMDKYFKILNQNNSKKDVIQSTRMKQNSILEESGIRKIKRSHHEPIIQENNSNQQIRLSEICKDIMIYRPLKNYSAYLPRLKPQVFRMK